MFRVMFVCTGNSCRSQMAEGFAGKYGAGLIEAHSAGVAPAGVNPYAIKVMAEAGIDISGQRSKAIDPAVFAAMDVVVTLCGHADMFCPKPSGGKEKLHWPIKDPVGTRGSEEEILDEFRRARDEIKEKVLGLVNGLKARNAP